MTEPNPYAPPGAPVADRPQATGAPSRRQLVPLWIKVFGWLIMLLGVAMPFTIVACLITGLPMTVSFLGLGHHGLPWHPMALLVMALALMHAVAAYGLLFGKDWGVQACMAVGFIGVLACLGGMGYSLLQGQLNLRLELVLQALFLRKLDKIRPLWASPVPSART